MRLRNWNWLENGVVPLLYLALRLCWVWPWLELWRRWLAPNSAQPFLPLWGMALLLVGGYAAAQSASALASSLARARIAVTTIGVALIAILLWWQYARSVAPLWNVQWAVVLAQEMASWGVMLPPPVVGLVVGAGVWISSMLDGVRLPRHDDIWRASLRGIIAFGLLLVASRLDPAGLPPHSDLWILAFFAGAMIALALSGLELARIGRRAQGGNRVDLRRNWVVSVLAIVLALLGAGLGLSLVVTPALLGRILGLIGDAIGWVLLAFGYVLIGIGTGIAWLLTPLFEGLQERLDTPDEREPPEQMGNMQEQMEELPSDPSAGLSPEFTAILQWAGLILLVVIVILAIAWALRLMRREEEESAVTETRESVFSTDLLGQQLSALWRQWQASRSGGAQFMADPYFSLDGEEDGRRAVRAAYQALLTEMDRVGLQRRRQQTPDEYRQALAAAWPDQEDHLAILTEAYRGIRYSNRVPTAEEVARVRQAWSSLQAAVQEYAARPAPS